LDTGEGGLSYYGIAKSLAACETRLNTESHGCVGTEATRGEHVTMSGKGGSRDMQSIRLYPDASTRWEKQEWGQVGVWAQWYTIL